MLRKVGLYSACAALLVAAGALSACGSSSGGNGPGPGDSGELADGGEDVFVPPGDGGEDSSTDSSMTNTDSGPVGDSGSVNPDASDGGCDFNEFVMQLITNHTNSTDLPSTDLGQNCTDTQTPFPASFF
jgi:hypothetical protein